MNVFFNTLTFFDFVTPKTQFAKLLIGFHHNILVILFFIGAALFYVKLTTNLNAYEMGVKNHQLSCYK